jgi:hypothetical protein
MPAAGRCGDFGKLPLRARNLIQTACQLVDHWAERSLNACLDDLDKRLFEQAEQARSQLEQQRYFDSRGLLEHGRTAFVQTFASKLRAGFEHLGAPIDEPLHKHGDASLSLLDWDEHELNAALDSLVARAEAQNLPILSELAYRLAVLVAAPPLEAEHSPLSPQRLTRILRASSEPLNLPLEHRILLVKMFESSSGRTLALLYESINAALLADGVLPHLHAFTAARIAHGPMAAGPSASATKAAVGSGAHDGETMAVLKTLRDLLAQQRLAAPAPLPDSRGRPATPEELQTALGALQQQLSQVTDRTSRELRSMQRMQEELLLQLNQGLPPGAARMRLSPEQGDTIELMSMLFEQLVQQMQQSSDARVLLGNLQLPLLRLAVSDHEFFDQQQHPARQWLGKLADIMETWLTEPSGELDQALLARLRPLVARAQQEPPSARLYASLLADIEHQLAPMIRKAQVAERHHVEAMQGRERMEQARRRADALMAERFAIAPPHGLLRTLLERAWTDVLALTLLRHDEHSEAFVHQLRVTDQLLGQFPINDPQELRKEVEASLQQIGMHKDEAEQVAQRLIPAPVPDEPETAKVGDANPPATIAADPVGEVLPPHVVDPPSTTDLAIRLKQHQRLGEHHSSEPHAAHGTPTPALGLREARIHNHLRQLPFGTWFEFTDPASGKATRYKLAWFSPVSGNSLFVNRRGQRGDVMNLMELARAIAEGRVRELPSQEESLLERAWHALADRLHHAATPPRPAP